MATLVARGAFPWRLSHALVLLAMTFWLLFGGEMALAQAALKLGNLPEAPAPKQDNGPALKQENEKEAVQKSQQSPLGTTIGLVSRRSVFFPELAHQIGPLSTEQKLELAADISIAPSRFASSAVTSAVAQARNALPGYGQGWSGYGKRYGSSLASTASGNMFGTFLLPSLFHQDPRYFVTPNGALQQRVGHALRRVIVTPTDSGGRAFNWSGILGALMAEGLANSYLPDQERTTGKTFRRFGIRLGTDAAVNIVREYWPSMFKSLGMTRFAPGASGRSESPSSP